MATIVNTMIDGLNQQMVQARLNSADAKPFLFGKHFPVKKVNGFSWRTVTNQLASKNVAADLHTDNGTILRRAAPCSKRLAVTSRSSRFRANSPALKSRITRRHAHWRKMPMPWHW